MHWTARFTAHVEHAKCRQISFQVLIQIPPEWQHLLIRCLHKLATCSRLYRPIRDVNSLSACCVNESEHVVENKVRAPFGHEEKRLHITHRLRLFVDHQRPGHHDHNAIILPRLCIYRVGSMLNFLKGQALSIRQQSIACGSSDTN